MPRGDRTGPQGAGRMTGRGAGYCAGYDRPGFAGGFSGGGRRRGLGLGMRRGLGSQAGNFEDRRFSDDIDARLNRIERTLDELKSKD